jgi:hypothetical protein
MSLARPNAIVTLSGQSYSAAEGAIVRLCASLSVFGSHDSIAITLWPSSKLAGAAIGSKITVALGDSGNETDLWSGEAVAVEQMPDAVVITGLASTVALSRTRVSQTYLDQSVVDIVRDLASSVDTDEVQGDLDLPAYTVDDRRPVWNHLLDLASLAGAELGASASGALRFVPVPAGSAEFTLRYGADVLDWHAATNAVPDSPAVAAYGAASEAGAEQWHWILSSPAPQGSGPFIRIEAAVRTRDAASALAQAFSSRAARTGAYGHIGLVGRADIRPGSLVAISGLDNDPGTLHVLAVDHLLDPRVGFVTTLTVEGASS